MKKLSLMIAALALVLGLSQCKKEEKPAASGEKQHIVLSANNGNDGSKVNVGVSGSLLNLTWETNDVIAVSGGASGELHLTGGAGTADATFEGDITLNRGGDIVFSVGSNNCMEQTGTLVGLKERIYLVGTSEYKEDRNYDVTMELQYAVLMLDLSAFADDTKGEEVTVTITSGEEPLASVTGITSASKAVYVALPADGTESKKYTFSNGKGMNAEMTWPLAANTFYTNSGSATGEAIVIPAAPAVPEGALSGKFTINEDGKQVYFSKGNLQYNMNTTAGADKWRFAPNQYECIGSANEDNVQDTTATTDTWIDLFGWGTSGNNHGAVCYQPWSTSQTSSDYRAYGKSNYCLYDDDGKADWGANAISNGGGSTWRTLTGGENGEWNYLINTREVNGETGYGNTCVWATVEGVNGLIIFHDGYKGTTSGLTSIPEGCVFLPAAGSREGAYGTSVSDVGSNGHYWSSSYNNNNLAYSLGFSSGNVKPGSLGNGRRCYGYSVRLVSVK